MTTITVTDAIGCKFPSTIETEGKRYMPRGMGIPILFFANRHAYRNGLRQFRERLTVNPDPNEGERRALS